MTALILSVLVAAAEPPPLVVRGATLIDLTGFGRSTSDMPDSVVIASGGRITAVGRASDVSIPQNATILDVPGKSSFPGSSTVSRD